MDEEVGTNTPGGGVIVKGKRTKRHRPHNSSPPADHHEAAASSESNYNAAAAMATASTAATSSDRVNTDEEDQDMANCLIMLAQGRRYGDPPLPHPHRGGRDHDKFTSRKFLEASPNSAGYYVYECKTCSKTFPSFQALGGHRASHKKPKLIPATKDEDLRVRRSNNNNIVLSDDDETASVDNRCPPAIVKSNTVANNFSSSNSLSLQLTNRALYSNTSTTTGHKARVHECSICGAEFASGQALGGHMRRHRGPATVGGGQTTATAIATTASLSLTPPPVGEDEKRSSSSSAAVETVNKKPSLDLDLNLPAMPDAEEVNTTTESKLVFSGKQLPEGAAATQAQKQQLVFSPPALVDCHY